MSEIIGLTFTCSRRNMLCDTAKRKNCCTSMGKHAKHCAVAYKVSLWFYETLSVC